MDILVERIIVIKACIRRRLPGVPAALFCCGRVAVLGRCCCGAACLFAPCGLLIKNCILPPISTTIFRVLKTLYAIFFPTRGATALRYTFEASRHIADTFS